MGEGYGGARKHFTSGFSLESGALYREVRVTLMISAERVTHAGGEEALIL